MRLRYDLLGCAVHGHALVGTDAAVVRPEDALVVLGDHDGLRWHRCLRCDTWSPRPVPDAPTRDTVPDRAEIDVPLRGRPLRDRFVLRLIALDRVLHVIGLASLGVAVLVFLARRDAWSPVAVEVLGTWQRALGGPVGHGGSTLLVEVERAFAVPSSTLAWLGGGLLAYAALEAVEAVGLWHAHRWAEYLTFVATTILLVPEIYELTHGASVTKVVGFLVNVLVVIYLLWSKRLFGVRGGGRAEAEERARDTGWPAVERAGPPPSLTRS